MDLCLGVRIMEVCNSQMETHTTLPEIESRKPSIPRMQTRMELKRMIGLTSKDQAFRQLSGKRQL